MIRAASTEAIASAGELIRSGALVAFPTETVYGLGADAGNEGAIARIFAVKQRPRFNPLIVHVPDIEQARKIADFDERAEALAERYWPGPLTLVLPRRTQAGLSLLVSAGLDTVALRAPSHAIALALLRAAGRPIAAPSANLSGSVSPTRAEHVASDLGDMVPLILDGGPCRIGVESTVIDLSGAVPTLLRVGGLAEDAVRKVLGPLAAASGGRPRSPGMLGRHYATKRPLRLNARSPKPGEVMLGFADAAKHVDLNLSESGNLEEAAANLFAMLRTLDTPEVAGIAVAPIPGHGLGQAINDRLRRAAQPALMVEDWPDNRGVAGPCLMPDPEEDA